MMLYEDHLHFIVRPLRLTLFEQTNYMPSLVRYGEKASTSQNRYSLFIHYIGGMYPN